MIKNRIVELLNDENKTIVYNALTQGSAVWCTNNQRTAPNSLITIDNYYTIGINPKDLSYFDFQILPLEKLIDSDDVIMIQEFTKENGIEQSEKAFRQSFDNVRCQYNLSDILNLSITEWEEAIKGV